MADSEITSDFIHLLRKFGHDMRVPLNTLISTSDMLVQGVYDALTPKQEKAATRLQRNSYRLLAILDDFVTYIKASEGQLEISLKPFDIKERLELWASPMKPILDAKNISLIIEVTESAPMILSDENLLKRVMQALLWNSTSFTEAGQIRVSVDHFPDAKWLIHIKDTGIGIPSQDLPHIFEPFWRGEARPQVPTAGAGLGLPLARVLAQLLKGEVTLKETSSSVTHFCVELAVQPQENR